MPILKLWEELWDRRISESSHETKAQQWDKKRKGGPRKRDLPRRGEGIEGGGVPDTTSRISRIVQEGIQVGRECKKQLSRLL